MKLLNIASLYTVFVHISCLSTFEGSPKVRLLAGLSLAWKLYLFKGKNAETVWSLALENATTPHVPQGHNMSLKP